MKTFKIAVLIAALLGSTTAFGQESGTTYNPAAVTQPVSASSLPLPTGASTAANQATEITSLGTIATNSGLPVPVVVNGTATPLTGLTPGASQTGTIIANNTDQTSLGGVAYGAMANFGVSPGAVKVPGSNAALFYGTTAAVGDPCAVNVSQQANINLSASGAAQIIPVQTGKKIYVCHMHMNNNAAEGILVLEGTGSNCGTGQTAVYGGTSAGQGYNFSANGGIAVGQGVTHVLQTNVTGDALCLNPSASTQLTGVIEWVAQ